MMSVRLLLAEVERERERLGLLLALGPLGRYGSSELGRLDITLGLPALVRFLDSGILGLGVGDPLLLRRLSAGLGRRTLGGLSCLGLLYL